MKGDIFWHTAKLILERDVASGMSAGTLTVDDRSLYAFRRTIENFTTGELLLGSFYTSGHGAARILFDDLVVVVAR